MDVCLRMLKESNNRSFNSYSVRNSVLIISHIAFQNVACIFFPTTFLEKAVYRIFCVNISLITPKEAHKCVGRKGSLNPDFTPCSTSVQTTT